MCRSSAAYFAKAMLDLFTGLANGQADLSPFWLFLFFFFGTFVSEDIACLVAGASVASGRSTFGLAVAACLAGIFAGDLLLYGFGRIIGPSVFRLSFVKRFVSETGIEKSRMWLSRNAASAVFISRFVSGLRLPTYLAAGALKANFVGFTIYFFLAAVIWTPILVGAAAFSLHRISPENIFIGIIFLAVLLRLVLKLSNWKYRRLVVGRIKRIFNWEFWPLAVFYFPVVTYVIYLGLRHRSFTLFTAVNPGIPAGGFVGESKNKIYRSLERSPIIGEHLLRYTKIDVSFCYAKRLVAAVNFVVRNDLHFPLVLKPDRGERGKGVTIIHDRQHLAQALLSADQDMILQEFYGGVEASIFYFRSPADASGQIFSITEKVFPEVVGDGVSTLEELILDDPRAVCMAQKYFEHHSDRLNSRPAKGKIVRLIDIGTHSRGAIFLDGAWLRTPELEAKIDEICRGIAGFDFGRFDIRADSFEDLKIGRKFKIIELNGVTSESTNIYDPKFSLIDAYRILFKQWKLAFEIGAANWRLGRVPLTLREFGRLVITRNASGSGDEQSDKLVNAPPSNACA